MNSMHRRVALGAATVVLCGTAIVMPRAAAAPPECFGRPATVIGTSGDDVLLGTAGDDVIFAGAGDDVVYAFGGDDLVCGGTGNDYLVGGPGDDRISGGDGNDVIYGNAGDDVLRGGNGHDHVYGGTGNDRIYGGSGNDVLVGEGGRDAIFGSTGDDVICGDGGSGTGRADELFGGSGDDQMYGGAGNDHMKGRRGSDYMRGQSGHDVMTGGRGRDTMYGDAGDDVVKGNQHNDYVHGGSGDDRLLGDRGQDVVIGGRGNDHVRGGSGDDAVYGLAGTDELFGNAGDDYLNDSDFNDVAGRLSGGTGDDECVYNVAGSVLDGCERSIRRSRGASARVPEPDGASPRPIAEVCDVPAVRTPPGPSTSLVNITDDPNPPWNGRVGASPISPHPIPAGFPTAATTGVPAGTTLRSRSGGLEIRNAGTVINGLDIEGVVQVYADNVTIRNSRITGSGFYVVRVMDNPSTGRTARNLVIEDTRIRGVGECHMAIGNSNYTLRRVLITGCADGAKAFSNTTIEESVIASLYRWDGTHNDAIQVSAGSNIRIHHNTILGPYRMSTSAILVKSDFGPIDGIEISQNYLSGGSYTLYTLQANGQVRNVRVVDNVFEGGSAFYDTFNENLDSTQLVESGNSTYRP